MNLAKQKKDTLVWMSTHRCKEHSHLYISHPQCYERDVRPDEKVGFFDIETSHLKADFGICFLYCIKEAGKDNIIQRVVTKKEIHTCLDKGVVKQCIIDLAKFDRVVTYYGTGFDLPFMRTRALYHKLSFPEFGSLFHTDAFYQVKNKLCLSRKSMENACRTVLGSTDKTHFEPTYWLKALMGDEKSLGFILDHCQKDVRDLEKLYNALNPYVKGVMNKSV